VLEDHLLIYPGYKGNPLEADSIFRVPHEYLESSVEQAEHLLFIGFAFRDSGINNILEEATRNSPQKHIVLINPAAQDELIPKLPKSFGNVVHIQERFGTEEAFERYSN
jgi:hypothetical protein